MICLTSTAGLCNRLRALDSSILLSRKTGHRLSVWWPVNGACAAQFGDLFEPLDVATCDSLLAKTFLATAFSDTRPAVLLRLALRGRGWRSLEGKLNQLFYPDRGPLDVTAIEEVSKSKVVCIRSDSAWLYPEDFSWLVPRSRIRETVASVISGFASMTIGVHIRRGDHTVAAAMNSTEVFTNAMKERITTHPESMFYLATDSATVRNQIVREFEGRIITTANDTSRNSLAGMRSAVVDLFCLARCAEIWATYGSSFGPTAHHIGKAPLSFPARRNS